MVAGSYRPLEDAFRIAHTQLIRWISAETGLSEMDAYQLVTQASRSPIANVCDANYTILRIAWDCDPSYLDQPTANERFGFATAAALEQVLKGKDRSAAWQSFDADWGEVRESD